MKKFLAISIVLGLAGPILAANSIPLSEDFESYLLGPRALIGGANNWIADINSEGISPGGFGNVAGPMDIASGGFLGSQGASNAGGASYWGSGMQFDPVGSGIVEINVNVKLEGYRLSLVVAGDGNAGNGNDRAFGSVSFYSYPYIPYTMMFDDIGWDAEGKLIMDNGISQNNWVDVNIHMDMDDPSMTIAWEDIDDNTGESLGTAGPPYSTA